MRVILAATLAVTLTVCAGRSGVPPAAIKLSTPAWIEPGSEVVITASSPHGGLRVVVTDAARKTLYDSERDRAVTNKHRVSFFFQPPYNSRWPYTVKATDAADGVVRRTIRIR